MAWDVEDLGSTGAGGGPAIAAECPVSVICNSEAFGHSKTSAMPLVTSVTRCH